MVRVTSHLYMPLSSVALLSVSLITNDDVLLLSVTCMIAINLFIAADVWLFTYIATYIANAVWAYILYTVWRETLERGNFGEFGE